ncbi:MAG: hypothetical protein ACLUQX_09575 [Thomasclavelia spiroformis]
MFEVQDRFRFTQTEQTITVYAVKKKGCTTFFLIYHRGNQQWEWKDADNFIPVE